ncbi:hypothetical protein [Dyadobacter chenhuakuii]|uniref:Uncharacterized protein n=1 Tax=Dyadobacter chenhuakuii TaxID=2909339 RepID=A0ABY4XMF0_9BACT|nr:hypothetical protein [Dyadobacter chenhuakuii]MCF2494309.1 hypothetical protein [Dyadobacter chenhuakuii]USJ31433.1 hypothetical protein NFI80_01565 [Dyadobacter chenhuakuii]
MDLFTVIWNKIGWFATTLTIHSDENPTNPASNTLVAEIELIGTGSHNEPRNLHGFFWKLPRKTMNMYNFSMERVKLQYILAVAN